MEYTKTTVREETFDVQGTTKLVIGDPGYFETIESGMDAGNEKKHVFKGRILKAWKGRIRIRQAHIAAELSDGGGKHEYDAIEVCVVQGSTEEMLDTYLTDMCYAGTTKDNIALGCDTASYMIETSFGYDEIHTGADGNFGHLFRFKQPYGMLLYLDFDGSLFGFDEVRERMLNLFPGKNCIRRC